MIGLLLKSSDSAEANLRQLLQMKFEKMMKMAGATL